MRFSNRFTLLLILVSIAVPTSLHAGEKSTSLRLTVAAGKFDRKNTPVRVDVSLPAGFSATDHVTLTDKSGKTITGQLTAPALLDPLRTSSEATSPAVLWFLLPDLPAGKTTSYDVTITPSDKPRAGFTWQDTKGEYTDLVLGDRKVARYMYKAYEDDPKKRDLNNKPFHHLFDPARKRLVTKGSGGMYTHHQGLYYGFTRCTWDGGKCNTWYCHEGEHELHKQVDEQVAGPVLARHRVKIDWNDTEGKPFCVEDRELAVFATPGGTLVEWSSSLRSVRGVVTLDGDPQHAGFQFRADNEVAAKRSKETVYLRPDGRDKPGVTRNWPADKTMTQLPWNTMSFMLGEQRYTAAYVDSPRNPKPSFYSERSYGRFGSWFGKQTLREDGPPVRITYRIWLQRGEMTGEQAVALSHDFATPPSVTVAVKK